MPLILVTGISTSGKSAVAIEPTKLGYEAYDTEHNGISAYYSKRTGERAAEFGQVPERTATWLDQHEWLMSVDWVKDMAKKAQNKTIFLCGGSSNMEQILPFCDKVIWLKTNEQTIRRRALEPRDHTYGTMPHELEKAIKGNVKHEAEFREYGATIVDATQPLEKVVEDILRAI